MRSNLNGKLLFIEVDGASRHRQSFLGLNTQSSSDDKILIKTLAVIDIHTRHKAEDIQNALEIVLDKFGIRKEQILELVLTTGQTWLKQ